MSLEDLAICVVPQDCRKIRQRQIHVDPPLVQQSRSVQHVEILNGKFKPGRLLKGLTLWRRNVGFSVRCDQDVEFRLCDCQFVKIDPVLQQHPKIHTDVDPAEMCERSILCGFQSAKDQVLETHPSLPEAPLEILQRYCCARPPFDFLHEIAAHAPVEGR